MSYAISTASPLPSNQNVAPQEFYTPSDILSIIAAQLANQAESRKLIHIKGIYSSNKRQDLKWVYHYGELRDEHGQCSITIVCDEKLAKTLPEGGLVSLGGVIERKPQMTGIISVQLKVSRADVVKTIAIDEDEKKRMAIQRYKAEVGFRNVDLLLEERIFRGERPRILLILAANSITLSDFGAGLNAALTSMDIRYFDISFSNPEGFVNCIRTIDPKQFDVVAFVRGGGSGLEKLDNPMVLQAVADLPIPTIAAVGHVEDKLCFKQVVDKVAPTPNGLGQYLSDIAERVAKKKADSTAVLTEQIRKHFEGQILDGKKQNEALQEKIQALNKSFEDTTNKYSAQLQTANAQNKEQLDSFNKALEEAGKKYENQMMEANKQNESLQGQLMSLSESISSSNKSHNEQINELKLQKENAIATAEALRKENEESLRRSEETANSLHDKIDALNGEMAKAKAWRWAAIIAAAAFLIAAIF